MKSPGVQVGPCLCEQNSRDAERKQTTSVVIAARLPRQSSCGNHQGRHRQTVFKAAGLIKPVGHGVTQQQTKDGAQVPTSAFLLNTKRFLSLCQLLTRSQNKQQLSCYALKLWCEPITDDWFLQ